MPLGIAALALIVAQAPTQSQLIEQGFKIQRDSSRPSYILGVEARERAAYSGGNALFFGGVPLPTLVYYSGMPCYFQPPATAELEETDLDGNTVNVGYHDLVMRDPDGSTVTLGNFDEVWNTDGPPLQRNAVLDTNAGAANIEP
jgi:hypothetical protein